MGALGKVCDANRLKAAPSNNGGNLGSDVVSKIKVQHLSHLNMKVSLSGTVWAAPYRTERSNSDKFIKIQFSLYLFVCPWDMLTHVQEILILHMRCSSPFSKKNPRTFYCPWLPALTSSEDSRSEKFSGVIRLMGRHIDWQQRSPRGGGIGREVKMRNGTGADKFLSAPGLLKLTRRFDRLKHNVENHLCLLEY